MVSSSYIGIVFLSLLHIDVTLKSLVHATKWISIAIQM